MLRRDFFRLQSHRETSRRWKYLQWTMKNPRFCIFLHWRGFYDSEKTSNHAIEELIAVSLSYKTPISPLTLCYFFSFAPFPSAFLKWHYWIRFVSSSSTFLLDIDCLFRQFRHWEQSMELCLCDLYRIILPIANQVNVPCVAFSSVSLLLFFQTSTMTWEWRFPCVTLSSQQTSILMRLLSKTKNNCFTISSLIFWKFYLLFFVELLSPPFYRFWLLLSATHSMMAW